MALERETPGKPDSDLLRWPRTSYFLRFTFTSKGFPAFFAEFLVLLLEETSLFFLEGIATCPVVTTPYLTVNQFGGRLKKS